MRIGHWWQWLLGIIGAFLERVGRVLSQQSQRSNAAAISDPANSDATGDPPQHWLDLLSQREIPLSWLQGEARNTERPFTPRGWQPRVLWNGGAQEEQERPASFEPTAGPPGLDNLQALRSPKPASQEPRRTASDKNSVKTATRKKGGLLLRTLIEPEDSPQPTRLPLIRQPSSLPVAPQERAENSAFGRSLYKGLPGSEGSAGLPTDFSSDGDVPDQSLSRLAPGGKGTSQPRYTALPPRLQPWRFERSQIPWLQPSIHSEPGAVPSTLADSDYGMGQPPAAFRQPQRTRLPTWRLERSRKPDRATTHWQETPLAGTASIRQDVFLAEAKPADYWPALPRDWLMTEPSLPDSAEQAHRLRLEREQRGE